MSRLPILFLGLCLSVTFTLGCGSGDEAGSDGTQTKNVSGDALGENGPNATLPTAAIGHGKKRGGEQSREPQFEKGSPEWIIHQIILLRRKPFPKTNDVKKLRQVRRERNYKIIELATEAIARTHKDPAKEAVLNDAVHQMMEARLQLALQGNRDDIDALYDDASSLHQRAPKSKAAAEAAFALARFAHTNARKFAEQEPRWLEEFARQAQQFAINYPHEISRGVSLLYAAGWSCESHRMNKEAVACYTLIQRKFPKTPQAQQVSAVLRRLALNGKPLQLAGPTIDGGFVDVDDYRGKVVLVVFWATGASRFYEQLPELLAVSAKYEKAGLQVVGINLDEDETAVDAFMEKNAVSWPQIFYTDPAKRRWENPIIKYYGIRDIPMLWLIDRNGIVVATQVDTEKLDMTVQRLLARQTTSAR